MSVKLNLYEQYLQKIVNNNFLILKKKKKRNLYYNKIPGNVEFTIYVLCLFQILLQFKVN